MTPTQVPGTVYGLALAVPTWAALAGAWWLGRHHADHHGTATLVALLLAVGAARAGTVGRR